MHGHGCAGHAAESDRRARGMGDDGGADSARGGEARSWADADHGRAGEAPGPRDLTAWLRANRSRRVSYRLSERTTGQAAATRRRCIGGEQTPRSDSTVPAVGGRRAGDAPAVPAARCVGRDGAEGEGECEFVSAAIADAERYRSRSRAWTRRSPVELGTQVWLEIDFTSDVTVTAASDQLRRGWLERISRAVCLHGRSAGPGADDDVSADRLYRGRRLRRWMGR